MRVLMRQLILTWHLTSGRMHTSPPRNPLFLCVQIWVGELCVTCSSEQGTCSRRTPMSSLKRATVLRDMRGTMSLLTMMLVM